jgi:hypothetical protein
MLFNWLILSPFRDLLDFPEAAFTFKSVHKRTFRGNLKKSKQIYN